ncbi:response regulator [Thiovibrio frasassiensis]|uniref:Response regulator n=1 Tax=Thiovibrio frasassiensis TaxID=2984131 RepID=A0A9X4MIS0_9BACT|nr:response regulator [Thiovibrio frasassiensis]MDG4476665.1 response regulator [Thiovibrio frasassiensis]
MSETNMRLLVVDDEPIVGKRLKQVFGKIGFEIETYTDSATALAAVAEKPFDIVVTDLKMEGIDGIEVLKRVRAMNPETRVIIITGYASADTAELAQEHGVFAFLAKPFRLDELKQVIYRAMETDRAK